MTGDEWLNQKLKWERTPDALHPMVTQVDGRQLRIRIGDFPEEPMYTLLEGDTEVLQFDDWPRTWQRPPAEKTSGIYKARPAPKTK